MSEIVLVRQEEAPIAEADKAIARNVLFNAIDGLGEKNRKAWRRFMNGLMRLDPGEMVTIITHRARSGPFHCRHMKIEQVIFEAQERFEDFKAFRDWSKVGAGFVDWYPGPKGAVMPVPKSISYSKLEDDAMRAFHDDFVAFMRTPHAAKTLWPKASAQHRIDAIENILQSFGE